MPRKRLSRPAKAAAPAPDSNVWTDPGLLQTETDPDAVDDLGLTVGDILGMPVIPHLANQELPDPAFATMADSLSELPDPTLGIDPRSVPSDSDYRPGDNEPPPGERPIEQGGDEHSLETRDETMQRLNEQRARVYDAQRQRAGASAGFEPKRVPNTGVIPAGSGINGEILPTGDIRYESRIQIVDAYRYPGTVANAPAWIDRNWVGFGDYDPVRQIEEGPCLRVPSTANPGEVVLCRIGDYVARQSVLMTDGSAPVLRTEVWSSEQFERLFVGVPRSSQKITGVPPRGKGRAA